MKFTSGEKDTYHQKVERADRHHDCQRKGRSDGRSDTLRQRFGHSCHKKCCWKIHQQSCLWVYCAKTFGYSHEWKRERSPSLLRDGKVKYGASLRTMCQLWQFLKNLVHPMTLRRRRATDCMSQVSRYREAGRIKLQNGFNP